MGRDSTVIRSDAVTARVEAPVTLRAYLMCAFAAFGGILFGYDSGYISGVLAMDYFKMEFGHPNSLDTENAYNGYLYHTWEKSLITSILSAGTFLGAIIAGDIADWLGRRTTVILGCFVFSVGVGLQVASTSLPLLVAGRLIAGFGVGLVSAIIILYMSEISPKAVRGAIVSGYQWAITLGLMLASVTNKGTMDRMDSASYRIPIAIQWLWAIILGTGLFFLPESPRWFVKKDRLEDAAHALGRLRGHPADSDYIKDELAELVANYRLEMAHMQATWADCFKGGLTKPSSNLRRVLLGILMQMMQQWTGVNFIFYYGTTFFQQAGISAPFTINIITTIVNVCSTPISFWTIERFGRRKLLIYGAIAMLVCEFTVAIVGTAAPNSRAASYCLITFVCLYIGAFASTWGPTAWVVIGEIFPLSIRARGVALSTASNWLWNFVISYITPYMVDKEQGNLGSKVFFVWGTTCTICVFFAYFLVPETKGLSLEQVDRMLEETTPRSSSKWVPHESFADDIVMESIEKRASIAGQEQVERV